uniref:Capsular polysaccharide transport system permease protein n=1 Tax=uncultured Thiotrichaceae bacterium TaxID=298394 RepID=A0A6S6U0Z8_9GAMM|nr:MAG: Capsular polysaccharide transport system permease protein [uncultured Thiotrichaceae bacterium]
MAKRRKKRLPWLFLLLVVFPTVFAGIYYYKFASDQFVSEAHFIIQGNDAPKVDVLGALSGIPAVGSGGSDAMIIQDYLQSLDFVNDIREAKKGVDIRKHFSSQYIDGHARLPSEATDEELRKYWQGMTEVEYDLGSGISKLRMTAFDAETSLRLVELALGESELLINRLTDPLRVDTLSFAKEEAGKAGKELSSIRAETTAFREQRDILDPVQEVVAERTAELSAEMNSRMSQLSQLEGIVAQLSGELARAEAEFADVSAYMRPHTLKVKAAHRKMTALQQQVNKAKAKAAQQRQVVKAKAQVKPRKQASGKKSTAKDVAKYAELQSRLEFAEQLYRAKLATLEQAEMDYKRKQRYLTEIVRPSLPDEAVKPDKLVGLLTVMLLSFLAWGVGSLSIAAVRDHVGWV